MGHIVIYGEGGYDTSKPNNNVVREYDEPDPPEFTNAILVSDKAATLITALEQADANWGALTAAQKDAAMRQAVRGVAKLARLALQRFDAS